MAALARLSLSRDELSSYSSEMSEILSFAQKIQAKDCKGETITAKNASLRPDVPMSFEDMDALRATAPEGELSDGCFTVPKAVD